MVQVQVTGDDRQGLERIIEHLLDRRWIACGQIVDGITSRYRWKESIETSEESLCLLKTTEALVDRVVAFVVAEHQYETPEVIVVPIIGGAPGYLDWVSDSVRP